MFGSTQLFPTQAQQQQQAVSGYSQPNSLQNVLENLSVLTAAVSGPELEGDDRDRIVSCLNQLLASCGVGKGYYKKGAAPYDFNINNPFYRLKAIGYNRLSRHKNSEGFVSLMLRVPATQIQSIPERQKVIDAINNILRAKSAPATTSFLSATQPAQSANTGIKIFTDLKSIIEHDENTTEIIINVNEYRRGIWNAVDLYTELTKPERINQLKSTINCEKIVPLLEVNKDELENYLKRPPPGFEELWPQAIQENPDPENLVPFPIQGFSQLVQRQKKQTAIITNQQTLVKDLMDRISIVERGICASYNKYIVSKQTQKHLSFRLLRILAAQTLGQRYGMMLNEKEEQLRSRLEVVQAHLNAPEGLRAKIMAIFAVLRKDGDCLKQRAHERLNSERMLTANISDIKRCLSSRQSLLEDLVGSIKASIDTLDTIENYHNK